MSVAEILSDIAEAFDEAREEFFGPDAKMLCLQFDNETQQFAVLETIQSGWNAYFSEYYGTTTFQVAKDNHDFTQKITEVSDVVVIDSTNLSLNNVLFKLKKDTQPPFGTEPFWKIRAGATSNRYEPPAP
jgi:hypothetical protein